MAVFIWTGHIATGRRADVLRVGLLWVFGFLHGASCLMAVVTIGTRNQQKPYPRVSENGFVHLVAEQPVIPLPDLFRCPFTADIGGSAIGMRQLRIMEASSVLCRLLHNAGAPLAASVLESLQRIFHAFVMTQSISHDIAVFNRHVC